MAQDSYQLPKTMKAAVLVLDDGLHGIHPPTTGPGPRPFRLSVRDDVPVPVPRPWEILVELSCTSVCGSDLGLAQGLIGPTCDILGHEGVGRVVSLGSGVDPSSAPRPGSRVGVGWIRDACGVCAACGSPFPDGETRCLSKAFSGRPGWPGTFARYTVVPARYALQLPDDDDGRLPDEAVAPVLCGGVTAYKAVRATGARPGGWVAVFGAGGGVGAFAVQYARAMGFRVAAVDLGAAKRALCLDRLGAEAFVDAGDNGSTVEERIAEVTGGAMVQAAVVTAGSEAAYGAAARSLAVLGTLVAVGIPPPDQQIRMHPLELIDRGVTVVGSAVGTRADTLEALEFVRRGLVRTFVEGITLEELDERIRLVNSATVKFVVHLGPQSGQQSKSSQPRPHI